MVVRFCVTQLIVHCHKHDELHAAHNETNDLDIPDVPPVGVKQNVSELSHPLQRLGCPTKEQHFSYLDSPTTVRGSRKFCQRGSKFFVFVFKLLRVERIQIPLKAGHHRPTSETPIVAQH